MEEFIEQNLGLELYPIQATIPENFSILKFNWGNSFERIAVSTPYSTESPQSLHFTNQPIEEEDQQEFINSENSEYAPPKFLNSSTVLKQRFLDEIGQEEYLYNLPVLKQITTEKFERQSYILIPIQSELASRMQLNFYDVFPAIFEQDKDEYILPAFLYSQ